MYLKTYRLQSMSNQNPNFFILKNKKRTSDPMTQVQILRDFFIYNLKQLDINVKSIGILVAETTSLRMLIGVIKTLI